MAPLDFDKAIAQAREKRKTAAAVEEVARRRAEAGIQPGETRSIPNPVDPTTIEDPIEPGEQDFVEIPVGQEGTKIKFPVIVGREQEAGPHIEKFIADYADSIDEEVRNRRTQVRLDRGREIAAGVAGAGSAIALGAATRGAPGPIALEAGIPGAVS